jgi:hypothetical protein
MRFTDDGVTITTNEDNGQPRTSDLFRETGSTPNCPRRWQAQFATSARASSSPGPSPQILGDWVAERRPGS